MLNRVLNMDLFVLGYLTSCIALSCVYTLIIDGSCYADRHVQFYAYRCVILACNKKENHKVLRIQ